MLYNSKSIPRLSDQGIDALVKILMDIEQEGGAQNEPAGQIKPAA